MRVRQVPQLSALIIDTIKDWQGYRIINLGAPTAAGHALRHGDEGLFDHNALLNYADNKHVVLPGTVAAVLSNHDLTRHPLAIIPTMDDGHIPALETLSYGAAFALAQIPNTLTGKDADTLDGYEAVTLLNPIHLDVFQGYPGTGTATDPEKLNDGSVSDLARFTAVDQYIEVDVQAKYVWREYRIRTVSGNTHEGLLKIQWWDGDSWEDLNTGVRTGGTSGTFSWSAWTALSTEVVTNKMRFVCTQVDAEDNDANCHEVEMR